MKFSKFKKFWLNQKGDATMLMGIIFAAVGLAVYMILGPSLVFPGVSSSQTYLANTSATANWTAQQVSMGTSTNVFALLAWVLVPVGIIVKVF